MNYLIAQLNYNNEYQSLLFQTPTIIDCEMSDTFIIVITIIETGMPIYRFAHSNISITLVSWED